ncbi:MAG: hypothetical protein Q8R00_01030 [Candidatus Nanoarchaeia archaeon]|nr:hypothetical protein [Candidatus Nanoarchaeia archaeon]
MEEIKKKYNEIASKKGLPSWDELDKEYELGYMSPLSEISFPLRFIRRRINDRFAWAANFFQGLLHPNSSSLISMQESKYFTAEDRNKISSLLREFMQIERLALTLDIDHNDENTINWIKDSHKKWMLHKKDLSFFAEKMRAGWTEETKSSGGAYFG